MPAAVSRKQYRMMMAIAHGHGDSSKSGGRGTPPKEIAAKYTDPGKNAPEQHGENRGGTWGDKHHATHHKKEAKKHGDKESKKGKEHRKKAAGHLKEHKKHLKKAFADFYKGNAAATIVMDDNNRILLGTHQSGGLAFAGGHCDDEDGGSKEITALRELKEEFGITGRNPQKVWSGKLNGNECDVFLVESFTGQPKSTNEMKDPHWVEPNEIPWGKLRNCCVEPLESLIREKMGKSLVGMMAIEKLEKNVVRQKSDAVLEVTHGDALRIVGNGLFRKIRSVVKDMQDESFKEFNIDTHKINIRKHMSDVYSGRVIDGHKVVYQWTNKSLPELTVALMSVFEWYLPEDEKDLELLDDSALPDDAVHGGMQNLIDNYKKHNIANIYEEMETIRSQIRNGMAVDLQQVESRIMTLFDKLEDVVQNITQKHNHLAEMASSEIDELESKLKELQSKIEDMGNRPETVEAFSVHRKDPVQIHDDNYPYLPRPEVEISPNGKIKITFNSGWTNLEKENFLQDLRAKVVKRGKLND